jgi:hypothetical protein
MSTETLTDEAPAFDPIRESALNSWLRHSQTLMELPIEQKQYLKRLVQQLAAPVPPAAEAMLSALEAQEGEALDQALQRMTGSFLQNLVEQVKNRMAQLSGPEDPAAAVLKPLYHLLSSVHYVRFVQD